MAMLRPIQRRISLEFDKYNLLSGKAKNLLLSFFFQGATNPIVGTFMNAYIWRIEGDFWGVAMFNLGNFIGLPITFFVNGYLLRFINIDYLYTIGSVTLGVGVMLVVLLAKFGFVNYLLFGLIFGLGYGLYWSNRNYLTLIQTESGNRNYFMGLNFTLDTITSITVPFIVGWFIYFGKNFGLETYVINAVVAFILLLISGIYVVKGKHITPVVNNLIAKNLSKKWHAVRTLTFGIGITDGLAFFLVSLLVLNSTEHEGILGTVDSIASIVLGILFYYYGRKAKVHHQKMMYLFSALIGLFGSVFLFFGTSSILNVVIFTCLYYFSIAFIWLSTEPMVMDIMDDEINTKHQNRYSLIFDKELFLNMGRWFSVLIFILCLNHFGNDLTLRIAPIVTYILHFTFLVFVWKKLKSEAQNG